LLELVEARYAARGAAEGTRRRKTRGEHGRERRAHRHGGRKDDHQVGAEEFTSATGTVLQHITII
jgi:hypothetical protein